MRLCMMFVALPICASQLWAQELVENCRWEVYVGLVVEGDTYAVSATSVASEMWNASCNLTDSISGASFDVAWADEFEVVGQNWPYGFDFIGSIQTSGISCTRLNSVRFLPYGLFRISWLSDPPQHSIYLDLRDDRWCYSGMPSDMWLRYDESTGDFEFTYNNQDSTFEAGTTVKLWDFYGGSQSTDRFQPSDPTNLTLSNSGGHPRLTWQRSEPRSSAKYLVYRGSTCLTSTAISDSTYLDTQVSIGGGSTITYKVRGVSGDGTKNSANYSNTVSTSGVLEDRPIALPDVDLHRYRLDPGYPNPFNPSTTVRYVLPSRSWVTLKVYNSLGQCVATLAEAELDAGGHEVKFDATNLSSGLYVCRMQAHQLEGGRVADFIEARTLLLVK
jgi:hypothetical protein